VPTALDGRTRCVDTGARTHAESDPHKTSPAKRITINARRDLSVLRSGVMRLFIPGPYPASGLIKKRGVGVG